MIHKLKFYTLLFSVLLSAFLISCKGQHSPDPETNDKPYVVMLSLDGFRWNYSQKANTPNLDRIAEIGVRAESLRPCFPTKTFPNHYSIATGLYPDNHGIVLNDFYDSALDASYSPGNRESVENGNFYGGEPLLAFDKIKKIIYILEYKNKKIKKNIHYSMTSNGSLIDNKILK